MPISNPNQQAGLPKTHSMSEDDLYTKNLTGKMDELDLLPDSKSVLTCFVNQCRKNPKELSDADKKTMQKTFAYLLENVKGESEAEIEKKRMFLCFNLLKLQPGLITQLDDMTFIMDHISQRNQSWIKTCIFQALKNKAQDEAPQKRIELHELITSLQGTVASLQETVTDLQKRQTKAKYVESKFEHELDKLHEDLAHLKALNKQFGIGDDSEPTKSLTVLDNKLSIYLQTLKESKSYKGMQAPTDLSFAEVQKKLASYKKSGKQDAILDASYIASELANIGLVLQEVVGGAFGQYWINLGIEVGRYSNPFIYGFKTLQRAIKLLGRNVLGLEFAEDEVGINPKQNLWDAVSGTIFLGVTTLLIVGSAIGLPLLDTIAWMLAPVGLGLVWMSEYGYQNDRARDRQNNMKESDGLFDETAQAESARVALHKKVASWALAGVIVFIAAGMLASSLAGIPFMSQVPWLLTTVTSIAGGALAFLAAARGGNFFIERKGKELVKAWKEFWEHPGESLVAGLRSLKDGIISLPGKLADLTVSLMHRAKDYWTGLSPWQKSSLIFSTAALALSISVLTGGIAPLIGLSVAGVCSLVSLSLKTYHAYKNKPSAEPEVQSLVEKTEPFKSDEECLEALEHLKSPEQSVTMSRSAVSVDSDDEKEPDAVVDGSKKLDAVVDAHVEDAADAVASVSRPGFSGS